MKICFINNLFEPYVCGGAEIGLKRLIDECSKKGIECVILTTHPYRNPASLLPDEYVEFGYRILRYFPLNLYHVYRGNRVKSILIKVIWHIIDLFNIHSFIVALYVLNREKPDIVHAYNLDGISYSVMWAAKLLRIPVVYTLNDYHQLCVKSNLMCGLTRYQVCARMPTACCARMLLNKFIINNIPVLVTGASDYVIEKHRKYGFFRNTIAKTIPYGIEFKTRKRKEKQAWKKSFLYVGNMSEAKGVRDLLVAASSMKREYDFELLLAGTGPHKEIFEKEFSEDRRIKFLGWKNREEIDELYSSTDVLVVPSRWEEVFGIVVIEALSARAFVIAADVGGLGEICRDINVCFTFQPGDIRELQSLLESACTNGLPGSLSENELQKYSINSVAEKHIDLYKQITQ